jgi:predicted transcriptional regulator
LKDLKEVLIDLLKDTKQPLTAEEIIENLNEKVEAEPSTIRQALRGLEEEKKIISFEQKQEIGRPKKVYRPVQAEEVKSITRNEYDRQNLLRQLIDDSAGRYSTMPFEESQRIFRSAAKCLLREKPQDLFLRFGVWLKEQHDVELKKFKELINNQLKKKAEKHQRNYIRLEWVAGEVFRQMIGIPSQMRQDDGTYRKSPFILTVGKGVSDESYLDPGELKKYIDWAVYGSSVIERFSISKSKLPLYIGGSDASNQPISLSSVLPWLMEHSEINIITAVGVRQNISNDTNYFDRYPEPKVLAQYERQQAMEEGLLIPPPGTLGFNPEMTDRVREAAMDLRQYIKDFDLMYKSEPAVKIQFRDGRIFPYEHRFSDAVQTNFHGEMVRSSLKAFRNIVNMVGAESGESLYCGFVKRPGTSIFAPLVMWYIGFGSKDELGNPIDPEMTLDDFLKSPYSDNFMVNQLFSVLGETLSDGQIYLTFRLLRRFQSMEEAYVQNFEPSADRVVWIKRLERFTKDYMGEGMELEGAEITATLCARASVLQFYCSLCVNPYYEPNAQIPRLELLLPYPDFKEILEKPEKGNEIQSKYLDKILCTLFNPGILMQYQESLRFFSQDSPDVFYVPKPVCDAHDCAKEIAKTYRDDFVELLIREAKIYWLQKTRGKSRFIPGVV